MSWFRRPDLPTKADLFLEDEYFWDNNTNFTRPENASNYHVTAPLVWCNNPGPDERVNIAFFVSCVTFAVTSCGMLVILRSKELRRMIGGILMCSICLTGMIGPLMHAINNFTVTSLHTMLPICIVTQLITNTLSNVGITTIAAMALDRAIAVSWHMRYFEVMTPIKCRLFMLAQWSICIAANSVPAMDANTKWCMKRYNGCGYNNSPAALYIQFGGIYVPSIVVIFGSYFKVWRVIRKLRVSDSGAGRRSRSTGVRTTVMIFVAFIVCYLPIAIWAMIDTSHGAGWLIYEDISTYMLNLSPAISIAIYGGTHRKFKKSFRELLRINQVNPMGSGENSHGSNKTSIRKISPGMFTVASLNA